MEIVVDEWGNVWARDDQEQKKPVMAHPELESTGKETCPSCGAFVWRARTHTGDFEWRCGCGKTFPGLHH